MPASTAGILDELLRPLKDDPERAAVLLDVDGVLAGTTLQQRLPTRSIGLGFAAFLVASALVLLA